MLQSCCHFSFFSFFINPNHGKHIFTSPFLTVHAIALPLASYCHPWKKKKKQPPGERVAIATTFARATPQSIHLSYMSQPGVSTDSITWESVFWGRKDVQEASRAVRQDTGSREEEEEVKEIKSQRESTDVQQLISLMGCLRRCTPAQLHVQAPSYVR